mmetsp:Transcript_8671/g.19074  ORF Transcript_8671/g.19074 Transcript_8671/m.19074 type:complete len:813 (-) Transcript_8671:43-2481(-)
MDSLCGNEGYSRVEASSPREVEVTQKGPTARTWLRFWVLWCLCSCASGVLPGASMFIKLFEEAGVYSSICPPPHGHEPGRHEAKLLASSAAKHGTAGATRALREEPEEPEAEEQRADEADGSVGCKESYLAMTAVMQGGMSLALIFLAPIGLWFDRWGARYCGAVGAAICALGAAFLWLSVLGAARGYDSITSSGFFLGVVISDFGAMMNSYSFMGLIWHFPGRQALILSLISATYQVSAFLPIIVKLIMDRTGVALYWIMAAYSVICAGVALACLVLVPSIGEYYAEAKRVLGMPLPRPPSELKPMLQFRRAFAVLARDPWDHCSSAIALALAMGLPSFYSALAAPYGEQLFGSQEDGTRLAELYTAVNGMVGLIAAPFCGAIADCLGLNIFVVVLSLVVGVATWFSAIADWKAQTITCLALVLFSSLFNLYIQRYLLMYSPPNRIGTVQGLYMIFAIMASMPETIGGIACVDMLPEGPAAYQIPLRAMGCLGTLVLALYSCYFWRNPPPDCPVLLEDDEIELSRAFGCGNLDEVQEVMGISSRKELVKKLASTDPDTLREMICSIDTEKMVEMMAKRPVEDIAAMMEEGLVGEDEEEEEEAEEPEALEAGAVSPAEDPSRERGGGEPASEEIRLLDSSRRYERVDPAPAPPSGAGGRWLGEGFDGADAGAGRAAGSGATANNDNKNNSSEGGAEQGGTEQVASRADQEKARIRGISDRLLSMLEAKDQEGLKQYLLKETIEDMWAVTLDNEERLTAAQQKKMDKDFEKLVPGKEFAKVLRQRPELSGFVQKLMKRELDRKIASMRGRKPK